MNVDQFTRHIEAMIARMTVLMRGLEAVPPAEQAPLGETFEALGTTVEELRVADAELRQQNGELEVARQAMQAERRHYQDLFEFAPDGSVVTDLFGLIREANCAAARLLDLRQDFLAGLPLANFVSQDQRRAFRCELARLPQVDRRTDGEVRLQPRKGRPFDPLLTAAVVRDRDGPAVGLRWMMRDVRARRRAQEPIGPLDEELGRRTHDRTAPVEAVEGPKQDGLGCERAARAEAEAAERRFRELVEGLDSIVWEADPATGRFPFVSRRAEEVLGYPVALWLAEPGFWAGWIHPEDRDYALANRRRCLREGYDVEHEYRAVAEDGRTVWLRESLRLIRDDPGAPRHLRGQMWNISRRKKVARQLYTAKRELAEQLDDMTHLHALSVRLSATLELELLLDEVLAAVMALQGAELGLLRLSDPERVELVVATSVGFDPEDLARFARLPVGRIACGRVVATRSRVVIEDVEADPASAADLDAARRAGYRAVHSTPLIARCGAVLGTIATFFREPHRPPERHLRLVEVYARQAADFVEAARLRRALQQADRRRDEAMATLAHELRNPLAAILHAVHALKAGPRDDPALAEVRGIVARQARHMARLVDRLAATRLPGPDGFEVARRPRELPDCAPQVVALSGSGQQGDGRPLRAGPFDDHLVQPVDPDDVRGRLGRKQ